MHVDVRWVWSDDPGDWATQGSAMVAALGAILTAIYVWFTYHLMKWTSRVAIAALDENRKTLLRRFAPVRHAVVDIGETARKMRDAIGRADMPLTSRLVPRVSYLVQTLQVRMDSVQPEASDVYDSLVPVLEALRNLDELLVTWLASTQRAATSGFPSPLKSPSANRQAPLPVE